MEMELACQDERTRTIFGNDPADDRGFNTVNDVVACPGHKMTVAENLYIRLHTRSQHWFPAEIREDTIAYVVGKLLDQVLVLFLSVAGQDPRPRKHDQHLRQSVHTDSLTYLRPSQWHVPMTETDLVSGMW